MLSMLKQIFSKIKLLHCHSENVNEMRRISATREILFTLKLKVTIPSLIFYQDFE